MLILSITCSSKHHWIHTSLETPPAPNITKVIPGIISCSYTELPDWFTKISRKAPLKMLGRYFSFPAKTAIETSFQLDLYFYSGGGGEGSYKRWSPTPCTGKTNALWTGHTSGSWTVLKKVKKELKIIRFFTSHYSDNSLVRSIHE